MSYVLPNRKAFADSITRIFLKYRKIDIDPLDAEDADVDLCLKNSSNSRELFPYQKIVREYLLTETPYRGLLLYHGLGSGKTCSSIAVAESLLSTRKIYVMLPASLAENFKEELRKCGDPFFQLEQHWEVKPIRSAEDREHAKAFGISDGFLDKAGRYYATIAEKPPNFKTLPLDVQKGISSQISDIIDQRFHFINYNGISKSNFETYFPADQPHMFDDSVVIIDEAHNFIGNVINESELKMKIYDMIYRAKNAKIVMLSGTPIINRPTEIAYTMNLLRGPIERVVIPTAQVISWDEGMMTTFFKSLPDVDTIEYNSVKRYIMLTRNPPNFETVYNEKGERTAVKYNKDFDQEPDIIKWVDTWKLKFQDKIAGTEVASDKIIKEDLECLPTKFEDFMNTFIDGLSVKNALMFQKRIAGLVSYFKGADERLLPKEVQPEQRLVKVPMSSEQFLRYLEKRWKEIQIDSRRGRTKSDLNDDQGSYRTISRLACNFAIPPELEPPTDEAQITENTVPNKSEILGRIKADAKRFLAEDTLSKFSPKMEQMLKNIKTNLGESPKFRNQLVYSFFKELEGLGLFSAILEANGFQEYKLKKTQGIYEEDPDMKPGVPAFAFFKGGEDPTERNYYREIFNNKFGDRFPQTLKDSIKEPGRLCVLLVSKAGAEGINLLNVRNVHIMESHWNPALLDQVIGRAIRICSHASLPIADRTVKVNVYLSVFSQEQQTGTEGPNIVMIRRNDMSLKRYDVEQPVDTFMTTDEYMYEIAYEKGRIAKSISHLLKQSAVDCEIHRKLHSREKPIIQCMRFDTTSTTEDLSFKPNYVADERDTLYLRNIIRKKRRLQKIKVKGIYMILDPDTNDIFDGSAFEDNNRLLKIGSRTSPSEIRFFT